jgi:hypothetical protein
MLTNTLATENDIEPEKDEHTVLDEFSKLLRVTLTSQMCDATTKQQMRFHYLAGTFLAEGKKHG